MPDPNGELQRRLEEVERQVNELVKKDEIAEAVAARLSDRRKSLFTGGERVIAFVVALCSIGAFIASLVTAGNS